jgi:hypothetical protein
MYLWVGGASRRRDRPPACDARGPQASRLRWREIGLRSSFSGDGPSRGTGPGATTRPCSPTRSQGSPARRRRVQPGYHPGARGILRAPSGSSRRRRGSPCHHGLVLWPARDATLRGCRRGLRRLPARPRPVRGGSGATRSRSRSGSSRRAEAAPAPLAAAPRRADRPPPGPLRTTALERGPRGAGRSSRAAEPPRDRPPPVRRRPRGDGRCPGGALGAAASPAPAEARLFRREVRGRGSAWPPPRSWAGRGAGPSDPKLAASLSAGARGRRLARHRAVPAVTARFGLRPADARLRAAVCGPERDGGGFREPPPFRPRLSTQRSPT